MEGVCGIFSSEVAAAWASAIGGLIAVFLTAWFYFKDRRERRNEAALAAVSDQRGREYRAWKHGLMLAPSLMAGAEQIRKLIAAREKGSGAVTAPKKDAFIIDVPDPRLLEQIDMYRVETQKSLLHFVGLLGPMNRALAYNTVGTEATRFSLSHEFWEDDFLQDLRDILATGDAAIAAIRAEGDAYGQVG